MSHIKRRFKGPTPPKRCQRNVMEGATLVQCKVRSYKAGLCIVHYGEYKNRNIIPELIQRCSEYKCFKTAVINIDDKFYCMKHFNQSQPNTTDD